MSESDRVAFLVGGEHPGFSVDNRALITALSYVEFDDAIAGRPSFALFNQAVALFPCSRDTWLKFVKFASETEKYMQTAERAIRACPHVDLFKHYLTACRGVRSLTEVIRAYAMALETVGHDRHSGDMWLSYIYFMKAVYNHRLLHGHGVKSEAELPAGVRMLPFLRVMPALDQLLTPEKLSVLDLPVVSEQFLLTLYEEACSIPNDRSDIIFDDLQHSEQTLLGNANILRGIPLASAQQPDMSAAGGRYGQPGAMSAGSLGSVPTGPKLPTAADIGPKYAAAKAAYSELSALYREVNLSLPPLPLSKESAQATKDNTRGWKRILAAVSKNSLELPERMAQDRIAFYAQQAVLFNCYSSYFWTELVLALLRRLDVKRAMQCLVEAITYIPFCVSLRLLYAQVLEEVGCPRESAVYLEKSAQFFRALELTDDANAGLLATHYLRSLARNFPEEVATAVARLKSDPELGLIWESSELVKYEARRISESVVPIGENFLDSEQAVDAKRGNSSSSHELHPDLRSGAKLFLAETAELLRQLDAQSQEGTHESNDLEEEGLSSFRVFQNGDETNPILEKLTKSVWESSADVSTSSSKIVAPDVGRLTGFNAEQGRPSDLQSRNQLAGGKSLDDMVLSSNNMAVSGKDVPDSVLAQWLIMSTSGDKGSSIVGNSPAEDSASSISGVGKSNWIVQLANLLPSNDLLCGIGSTASACSYHGSFYAPSTDSILMALTSWKADDSKGEASARKSGAVPASSSSSLTSSGSPFNLAKLKPLADDSFLQRFKAKEPALQALNAAKHQNRKLALSLKHGTLSEAELATGQANGEAVAKSALVKEGAAALSALSASYAASVAESSSPESLAAFKELLSNKRARDEFETFKTKTLDPLAGVTMKMKAELESKGNRLPTEVKGAPGAMQTTAEFARGGAGSLFRDRVNYQRNLVSNFFKLLRSEA